MCTRLRPISAATRLLAGALALAAALSVEAAIFGDVVAVSAVGTPLRVEIDSPDSGVQAASECLRVPPPGGASDGLPAVRNARVTIVGHGADTRIVVSADTPAFEPIMRLTLENVCAARLRRDYTLLLSPPTGVAAPAVTPPTAATQQPGIAAATSRPAAPPQSTPVTRPAAASAPAARAAPRRAAPAATTAAAPTPSIAPARARVPDRLVLQADADSAGDAGPGVRMDGADASMHAEDQIRIREERLVAAIDRSITMQLELMERIRRLEEVQLALQAAIEDSDVPLELAARERASTMTVDDAIPERDGPPPPANAQDWFLWAMLLGALGAGAGAMALRRGTDAEAPASRADDHDAPASTPPTPPPNAEGGTAALQSLAERPRDQGRPVPTSDWRKDSGSSTPELPSLAPLALEDEVVEEHDSAVELADIMMSFGRVQGAAETLAEFIQSNPKRAITPWLKLMDVYRHGDMRDQFDTLARQLNQTFNVRTVTWDNFDEARNPENNLEQMPHIIDLLVRIWGTRECQSYLERILRDNREGTRHGFALGVIDDILMLAGVLEQQLGRHQGGHDA